MTSHSINNALSVELVDIYLKELVVSGISKSILKEQYNFFNFYPQLL